MNRSEAGKKKFELNEDTYAVILMALGYATGAALKDKEPRVAKLFASCLREITQAYHDGVDPSHPVITVGMTTDDFVKMCLDQDREKVKGDGSGSPSSS